jgi:hypothetical protein
MLSLGGNQVIMRLLLHKMRSNIIFFIHLGKIQKEVIRSPQMFLKMTIEKIVIKEKDLILTEIMDRSQTNFIKIITVSSNILIATNIKRKKILNRSK